MATFIGQSFWDRLFTFTVVRNPWDRMVSFYRWRSMTDRLVGKTAFRDFIMRLSERSANDLMFRRHHSYFGSADYLLDKDGKIMVDCIIRFEERFDGIKQVSSRLGMNSLGRLKVQSSLMSGEHYSEFYDSDTIEIVRDLYRTDIELFGYEFEMSEGIAL